MKCPNPTCESLSCLKNRRHVVKDVYIYVPTYSTILYTKNMKLPHNIIVIATSNTYYAAPESTFI